MSVKEKLGKIVVLGVGPCGDSPPPPPRWRSRDQAPLLHGHLGLGEMEMHWQVPPSVRTLCLKGPNKSR